MASTSDTANQAAASAQEQIRQLREQVDGLLRERVSPMLSDAAQRAQDAARQAQDLAQDQVEALSGRIREAPLVSILVAAAVGFVVGRIAR